MLNLRCLPSYISITKPEDYQLVYHTSQNGHIWLDAKHRSIPLTQTLTGHIDSTDPVLLWYSRVTREGYNSVLLLLAREVQLTALQLHNNSRTFNSHQSYSEFSHSPTRGRPHWWNIKRGNQWSSDPKKLSEGSFDEVSSAVGNLGNLNTS